jgi:hypothetical protein
LAVKNHLHSSSDVREVVSSTVNNKQKQRSLIVQLQNIHTPIQEGQTGPTATKNSPLIQQNLSEPTRVLPPPPHSGADFVNSGVHFTTCIFCITLHYIQTYH